MAEPANDVPASSMRYHKIFRFSTYAILLWPPPLCCLVQSQGSKDSTLSLVTICCSTADGIHLFLMAVGTCGALVQGMHAASSRAQCVKLSDSAESVSGLCFCPQMLHVHGILCRCGVQVPSCQCPLCSLVVSSTLWAATLLTHRG